MLVKVLVPNRLKSGSSMLVTKTRPVVVLLKEEFTTTMFIVAFCPRLRASKEPTVPVELVTTESMVRSRSPTTSTMNTVPMSSAITLSKTTVVISDS